jgi:hypothetical protein
MFNSTHSRNQQEQQIALAEDFVGSANTDGSLLCRLERQESSRIGVHQLRRFLEALLQRRYLDSIPVIVPLLDREARSVAGRLDAAKKELAGLAVDKLKVRCHCMGSAHVIWDLVSVCFPFWSIACTWSSPYM